MTFARLYGNVLDYGSLAVVTAGFRDVLTARGLLAGVHGLDVPDNEETAGAAAQAGIYTGPMSHVRELFLRGMHRRRYLMIAPNSTQLPIDLTRVLKRYGKQYPLEFLAPSEWASGVVREHLGSCMTVRHGVHEAYRVDEEAAEFLRAEYAASRVRVIHFSTSDRQRKGTLELIQAWLILTARCPAIDLKLLCVMDYLAEQRLREELLDREITLPESVHIRPRAELGPHGMARTLSRSHLVCQPSRGEGFGLVPLEALACGVPVVATACTGHSEYLYVPGRRGAMVIPTAGPLAPIDDLPGAMAPRLAPPDIAKMLEIAIANWQGVQAEALAQAPQIQKEWSWEASLAPFVEHLMTKGSTT